MKFSDKVAKLRKRYGYTQGTLAETVGVTRQSVYKWESGSSYPEVDKLLKLARTLQITVDDLINEEMGLDENGVAKPMTEEESAQIEVKRLKKFTRKSKKAEGAAEEATEAAPAEEVEAEEPAPAEEAKAEEPAPAEEAKAEEPAPAEEVKAEEPAPVEEAKAEEPAPAEKKPEKKRGGLFGWFRRNK